jgi:hypothetical protein
VFAQLRQACGDIYFGDLPLLFIKDFYYGIPDSFD